MKPGRHKDKPVRMTMSIPIVFNELSFVNKYIIKSNNNKFGLTNEKGDVIYQTDNDEILKLDNNCYSIKKDNFYSIYFCKKTIKTKFEFLKIYFDKSNLVIVQKENKVGAFNTNGELIIPYDKYENIKKISDNYLSIVKNNKIGLINPNGDVLIAPLYDIIEPIEEVNYKDFFIVKNNNKYGIINNKGETIIPNKYDYVNYRNEIFIVGDKNTEKIGIINKKGEILIPISNGYALNSGYENDILILKSIDNTYNFLNKNGKFLFSENIIEFGYVMNEEKLKNNENISKIIYYKDKKISLV